MATSGTSTFTQTRDQIIKSALRKIEAIAAGSTPNATLIQDSADALNAMVKHWGARDIRVWTVAEGVLIPQPSQVRYALATTASDHAMLADDLVTTSLTAAASAGSTALTVDSITDIAASDHLGVLLDDGTVNWTTVNGAPSGSTVTAAVALTGAAASGNTVFAYTNRMVRPLKVVDARRYNLSSGIDTPLSPPMARLDYQALPNKAQAGAINRVFYDAQLSTGYLYLWQPLARVTDLVKFTHHRPIEDFNAAGNTPDLPPEWVLALTFNLAVIMAPEFGKMDYISMGGPVSIAAMAQQYLDEATAFGREDESISFGPDLEGY
jgi:hypothetical protein